MWCRISRITYWWFCARLQYLHCISNLGILQSWTNPSIWQFFIWYHSQVPIKWDWNLIAIIRFLLWNLSNAGVFHWQPKVVSMTSVGCPFTGDIFHRLCLDKCILWSFMSVHMIHSLNGTFRPFWLSSIGQVDLVDIEGTANFVPYQSFSQVFATHLKIGYP